MIAGQGVPPDRLVVSVDERRGALLDVTVRPFEGDQQASARGWIGEVGAGGAAQSRQRAAHGG